MGISGGSWNCASLGDLCDLKYGKIVRKSELSSSGYPVWSGYSVVGFHDRFMFEEPQVTITCRGVGGTGNVHLTPPRCWLTNLAISIIPHDQSRVDKDFLYWALKSTNRGDLITGSAQYQITIDHLSRHLVPLPPLAEQKAIAAVLGALDDKIELNRRMNATLEAMARALFSNWIQSHDDEIGEHLVQDLIAERVLVIGDGYRAKNSEFADDGLPFIRAGNLRGDGLDLAGADVLSASSVKAAGHKVGMVGDVAFTSKGTVGRITRVSSKTGSFVYSPQVCFWRSTDPDKLHPNVLYRWMSTDDFTRQVATVSTQTDMAPYVSLQDQRKMVIQLPPPSAQREIATQLEAIDEKIAANAEQSRTLATLRDTLLPKLLSGEVSVKRLGA